MIKFFTKYHKWLGVFLTILILLFSASGILLNHRNLVSGINISRKLLPKEYEYKNWNKGAVKGTLKITEDSILVYGNIGIWLTDSNAIHFTDFNSGFPKGIDNRKICKVYKTRTGEIFAGTLFGLYHYNKSVKQWQKIPLDLHNPRIVDITEKQDTLIVLSRSFLLQSTDYQNFTKHILPEPENYDNKIGLFKTLWVIHSGELYGKIGKLFVDLIGLIFLFLSISGLILFINKYIVKSKKRKGKNVAKLISVSRWNLKWHNKIGWITLIFLIITTITGMFLRPPLLITIADAKVGKIPFTILDTENAWFDKLRRIIYDEKNNRYIIASVNGVYYSSDNFNTKLNSYGQHPPISVMGVNVFEQISSNKILIGSFEGLFLWDTKTGSIFDYIENKPYIKPKINGSPIGKYLVTGYTKDINDAEIYFDFNSGANTIKGNEKFPPMPNLIKNQPMSLWNVLLEVHTARIYHSLIGIFYFLIIPLTGLFTVFVLISGFVVWFKRYKK